MTLQGLIDTGDIASVNHKANEMNGSSMLVRDNAELLSRLAGDLTDMVGRFKV